MKFNFKGIQIYGYILFGILMLVVKEFLRIWIPGVNTCESWLFWCAAMGLVGWAVFIHKEKPPSNGPPGTTGTP